MNVPTWLLVTLMVLAVFRLTRLVVNDDFPPVLWLRDRFVGGWRKLTTDEIASMKYTTDRPDVVEGDGPKMRYVAKWRWVPNWISDLLSCPWCASGWIALGVTVGVAFTVGVPAPLIVWPAVWGGGALLASRQW